MLANTIDEVIDYLEVIIEQSKKEESPLGYFAALYQNVTISVKDKLNTNYFDNDERMEQLDVVFANRYLSAYSEYKKGDPITKSWKMAFDASTNKSLIVLQHLILGMNAHINLDLGIAAAQISNQETITALEPDFNKINEILSSLVDEIQRDLSKIWPTLLKILKFLKKVDDFFINFSMKMARDSAWKFANELVVNTRIPPNQLIEIKDQKVAAFASIITHQGFLVKLLLLIMRMSEKRNIADKITSLEKKLADRRIANS